MRCFFKAVAAYADFEGRATRREFWLFFLIWAILGGIAIWVDLRLGIYAINFRNGIGIFSITWLVALMLPWLAVSVRRLHDTGRSGWWVLSFPLLPLYLYLMAVPGAEAPNRFGRAEPPWC